MTLKPSNAILFPFMGFLILKNGQIIEYGQAVDLRKEGTSIDVSSHRLSLLESLKQIKYDISRLKGNNINLLAQELVKENIITYVNMDGTSKNKIGILHIGYVLTQEQKETLMTLQSFFYSIPDFVVDFHGCLLEISDFYHRLEDCTQIKQKLYMEHF